MSEANGSVTQEEDSSLLNGTVDMKGPQTDVIEPVPSQEPTRHLGIPAGFQMKMSSQPDQGNSIWTSIGLAKGTLFGPFRGRVMQSYVDRSSRFGIIPEGDDISSLWICLLLRVTSAPHNMVLTSVNGDCNYLIATMDISSDSELMVRHQLITETEDHSELLGLLDGAGTGMAEDDAAETDVAEDDVAETDVAEADAAEAHVAEVQLNVTATDVAEADIPDAQIPHSLTGVAVVVKEIFNSEERLIENGGEHLSGSKGDGDEHNSSTHETDDFEDDVPEVQPKRQCKVGRKAGKTVAHKCSTCDKTYRYPGRLKIHMRTHKEPSERYETGKTRRVPRKQSEGPLRCPKCSFSTKTEDQLALHVQCHTESGELVYKCPICDYSFRDVVGLHKHMQFQASNTPLKCPECSKIFCHQKLFDKHVKSHSLEFCSVCEKEFSAPSLLATHMLSHSKERPHDCELCGKSYKHHITLKEHIKAKHSGDTPFQCSVCGNLFPTINTLNVHTRKSHSGKNHVCSTCGQSFRSAYRFKVHQWNHSKDERFKCPTCGKLFASTINLANHCRSHTREKSNYCSECDKNFSSPANLEKHIKTHGQNKPHRCSTCDKAFRYQCHLTEHMRTHTGEKPYSCSVCGRSCTTACKLTIHMRTHTGAKPLQCPSCPKTFASSASLVRHKRTHSKGCPHRCPTCGEAFLTPSELAAHCQTHTSQGTTNG